MIGVTANGIRLRANLPPPRVARRRRVGEMLIEALLLISALSAIFITLAIVYVLVRESAAFFAQVSLLDFVTDTQWTIMFEDKHYGIAPLLAGTFVTSTIGLLVAVPLGTVIAIYLSEFAQHRVREFVKPLLELLIGVPTVVFGYFALLFVTPLLQKVVPDLPGFNMLGPGIVIGIMITPYISSLAEDAMRAVPMQLREGAYAMGATRFRAALTVVVPAALSGIVAAYVLGVSRAAGETMVVAIAAGQQPNLTLDPLQPAATITSFIVQVALGDLAHGSVEYQSIFAAGLVLLLMTLIFNVIGHLLRKRFREIY